MAGMRYILTRNQLSQLNQQGYVDIVRDGKTIRVTYPMVAYATFKERDHAEKIEAIPFKRKKPIPEPAASPTISPKKTWLDSPCYYVAGKTDRGVVKILLGPFKTESVSKKYAYFSPKNADGRSAPHTKLITAISKQFPAMRISTFASISLPDGKKSGLLNDFVRGYKTDSTK
jgi:hypothetical protein